MDAAKEREKPAAEGGSVGTSLKPVQRWRPTKECTLLCLGALLALAAGLTAGILISNLSKSQPAAVNFDSSASSEMQQQVSAQRIRSYLQQLTERVHWAGSDDNGRVRQLIERQMESCGLRVLQDSHDVLLSFPSASRPNGVRLLSSAGAVVHQAALPAWAFNAFSPAANVTAQPLFANYARSADFAALARRNISCNNTVVFARYGRSKRSEKVKLAHSCGASAVVLYLDPADYLVHNDSGHVPLAALLKPDAIQLGNVLFNKSVLPQDRPAKVVEPINVVKQIPSQPIGYVDADVFLSNLANVAPESSWPDDWNSGLQSLSPGTTGPGYDGGWRGYQIQLETHNELRWVTIMNIVARLDGAVEPDRYVIIGCHYDAWSYGATDPLSGTAIMLELATVLNERRKADNWRPRRTIMLVHWDAEEQGLVGSTRFARRFRWLVEQRAVVYVNLDSAVMGNWQLLVGALPQLYDVIFDASRAVRAPDGQQSLFDQWLQRSATNASEPPIHPVTSSSDHYAFLFLIGIPTAVLGSTFNKQIYAYTYYPHYHTFYDNLTTVDEWSDPGFVYHAAMTKLMIEVTLRLADSVRLPLSAVRAAEYVRTQSLRVEQVMGDLKNVTDCAAASELSAERLMDASKQLVEAAAKLQRRQAATPLDNAAQTRVINDALMSMSRAFVPLRRDGSSLNVLHAVSSNDAFPFLNAAIDALRTNFTDQAKCTDVRYELDLVVQAVRSATSLLQV